MYACNYQEAIREKFEEARVNECLSETDVEKAWSELKEVLVVASSSVCVCVGGVLRGDTVGRRGQEGGMKR